jgi:hypothetical protein
MTKGMNIQKSCRGLGRMKERVRDSSWRKDIREEMFCSERKGNWTGT